MCLSQETSCFLRKWWQKAKLNSIKQELLVILFAQSHNRDDLASNSLYYVSMIWLLRELFKCMPLPCIHTCR